LTIGGGGSSLIDVTYGPTCDTVYDVVLVGSGAAIGRRGGTLDARMTLFVTGVGGRMSMSSSTSTAYREAALRRGTVVETIVVGRPAGGRGGLRRLLVVVTVERLVTATGGACSD
jgi:hypothetical protein